MNEERTGKCLQQWNISVVISDTYIPYGLTKSRSYVLFIVIIQPVFLHSQLTTGFLTQVHNGRHQWNKNWLSFRSTWVNPGCHLGFCFVDRCLSLSFFGCLLYYFPSLHCFWYPLLVSSNLPSFQLCAMTVATF